MEAVVWENHLDNVSVKRVTKPKIEDRLDAIVRVSLAGICGTDLHTYHKRLDVPAGLTLGHETLGTVEEVGSGVEPELLKVGDRVVVWAGVACGICDNCSIGLPIFCLAQGKVDPGGYGIAGYGGASYNGGQAQYLRVPWSTFNCIKLPTDLSRDLDYLLLSDIFPTAWYAVTCSGFQPGDSVAVFGAGPVGLLAAYSALLRGASKVYSVDHVPKRLKKAQEIGAIPIDFSKGDPVAQIMALEPAGVDRSVEAVGFECVNAEGQNDPFLAVRQCISVTGLAGGIGSIGVFALADLKGPTKAEKQGNYQIPYGEVWEKGLSIKGGPADIRPLYVPLKKLIDSGRAKPSIVIDTEISIKDAPKTYRKFSNHEIIKAVFRFDTAAEASNGTKATAVVADGTKTDATTANDSTAVNGNKHDSASNGESSAKKRRREL